MELSICDGWETLGLQSVCCGEVSAALGPESNRVCKCLPTSDSVVQFKTCPVQLSYKAAEVDKMKMAEALEARHHAKKEELLPPTPSAETKTDLGLPELRYSLDDMDGWTTMEEPLLYVYAGKGPYVSR